MTVPHLPFSPGPAHFVGIGGIGMSGIAEIMLRQGYAVQGSDAKAGPNTERLAQLGARVFIGHAADQVSGASAIVYSSAIARDNPELVAGREQGLPLVRRAEMLAELMRLKLSIAVAGVHGKTTTTSLVAALLDAGGLDPTVVNGGVINAYGANAKVGDGDWIVVEADESDGTFLKLPRTAAIVTNIDPEHLDHYGDYAHLKTAFRTFVEGIAFYGFAALCIDNPDVRDLAASVESRRIITYGFDAQARVRALNVVAGAEESTFDVEAISSGAASRRIEGLRLPMAGRHNVQNALAAITAALELGVDDEAIRAGLAEFAGVRRRFSFVGEVGGVRVIDDYGHHPVEIASVLAAARVAGQGRVIAVVQPHRFTRLLALFDDFCRCFDDADVVIVADVYPAGEAPIGGYDRDALVAGLRRHGHARVLPLSSPALLPELVAREARSGDRVIFLGAGDITAWAHALPPQLRALMDE
ncbi:MAG: UDP-N-acetylmuramate--L-alanine ligase [Caulobacteraceae bacterium]